MTVIPIKVNSHIPMIKKKKKAAEERILLAK